MVGTPGRLEDLISTGKLELSSCRFFVLDECVSFILCDCRSGFGLSAKMLLCKLGIFFVYIVCTVLKDPPPYVTLSDTPVERVMSFKLLGVYVASDLKWEQHIDTITSKAASRLYFLKQLKLVYLDIFSLHLSLMHRV